MGKGYNEIRYCSDIGMYALDRAPSTCKYATAYCRKHCYNLKLYICYKDMRKKDIRNELYWDNVPVDYFTMHINQKRKFQTDRFRFCTRGEQLSTAADVEKTAALVSTRKQTTFWIPTRAWRDPQLRQLIENKLFPLGNVRVLASIDPSNSLEEVENIALRGWSTMFFGNDSVHPLGNKAVKCPKTWKKIDGACATCTMGCFSDEQKHVWLSKH